MPYLLSHYYHSLLIVAWVRNVTAVFLQLFLLAFFWKRELIGQPKFSGSYVFRATFKNVLKMNRNGIEHPNTIAIGLKYGVYAQTVVYGLAHCGILLGEGVVH